MSIDFPNAPTNGQVFTSGAMSWTYDGTKWVAGGAQAKYIIGCYVPGLLTASQYLLVHTFGKATTIPANFGAYLGHASQGRGGAAATGSVAIDVRKATAAAPGTFSSVGTISVAAAALLATFATTGGTAITFAAGDTIAVVAPATPDATFNNFNATLVGYET